MDHGEEVIVQFIVHVELPEDTHGRTWDGSEGAGLLKWIAEEGGPRGMFKEFSRGALRKSNQSWAFRKTVVSFPRLVMASRHGASDIFVTVTHTKTMPSEETKVRSCPLVSHSLSDHYSRRGSTRSSSSDA